MAPEDSNNVIHRMTRVARDGYNARAMSPSKALRLALAQSAERSIGLALTVTAVEQVELAQAGLSDALDKEGLLILLDGPEGLRGGLGFDLSFLGAMIEMQIVGRVREKLPEPRELTRTDAAIAAALIDPTLTQFAKLLTEEESDHWGAGYRFGAMADDVRNLCLALSEAQYHHFRVMVEIGDSARAAVMSLLLPAREMPVRSAEPDGAADRAGPGRTLEHSALEAPVCLQAVLTRVKLPLDRICSLRPGGMLPVSSDRPFALRLEVGHKHMVAQAWLGQINGMRAARLTETGAPPATPALPRATTERAPPDGAAKLAKATVAAEQEPRATKPERQEAVRTEPESPLAAAQEGPKPA